MDITAIVVAIIGSGILNTILNYFIATSEKKNKDSCNIQQALRLIMKDRLRFLCAEYIQQGWIYEDELEDIIVMHDLYHNDLNGNGFLDEVMDRVKNLEIRVNGR